MKTNKIFRNVAAASALILAGTMVSCTDKYDHYEGNVEAVENATSSAWALISTNSELSDFARILQSQGYDRILSGSETYTIWAPKTGSFNAADITKMTSEQIEKQFIQNHIARNSYPASGSIDQKLFSMNKKSLHFAGNGVYAINNINVARPNVATSNGVLHIIDGQLPYFENIYETFSSNDPSLSCVTAYYKKYEKRVLNLDKSVLGTIVDGEQTYLDSVFDESNNLFHELRQYINEEDSNYTMILPSNEAWEKSYKTLRTYFKYPNEYNTVDEIPVRERGKSDKQMLDILNGDTTKIKKIIVDAEMMTDSMANKFLCAGLCFNNNLYYNKALANYQTGSSFETDSIVSTTGTIIHAADAKTLVEGMTKVTKSNGAVLYCTDTLRVPQWSSLRSPMFKSEAETNRLAHNSAIEPTHERVTAITLNPAVVSNSRFTNNAYLLVAPEASNGNPTVVIGVGGRSGTKYNIYVTCVPNNITNDRVEPLPNRFQAYIGYSDADGKLVETTLKGLTGKQSSFETVAGEVCEVCLGSIEFPVVPQMAYIRLVGYASGAKYDRTLRIENILLVPEELDARLKEDPSLIKNIDYYKY